MVRLWSLREDAQVEFGEPTVVCTRWGDVVIPEPTPLVLDWLNRMSLGPVSLENALGTEPAGDAERVLELLADSVVHTLGLTDISGPLLSAVPITRKAAFELPEIDVDRPVRLSRFAAMRAVDGQIVLESPLARHRVVFHRPLATRVVGALGSVTTIAGLARALEIPVEVVGGIVALVTAARMVVLGESGARFAEDDDPRLAVWSHSDLLFHSRSRLGLHDNSAGTAITSFPPPLKTPPGGQRFALQRPVLANLSTKDPALVDVMESQRAHHQFGTDELSAEQLGELLFRTVRVRSWRKEYRGGVEYSVSDRPYANDLDPRELELYLTLARCEGLPAGIYHYDAERHALTLIDASRSQVGELLEQARVVAGALQAPPALITMTARMANAPWLRRGTAYAAILRAVGSLQQAMQLAATAMGLASCVLDVGDLEVAAGAFRLDWPGEVAVGEFAVGVRVDRVLAAG